MDFQNKRRPLNRRNYINQYGSRPNSPQPAQKKEPDILEIWEQQRRMREREAQLEREYESAKRHIRELQIKMKQNTGMLADVSDLQTTVREDTVRGLKNVRLWAVKTYRKLNVKAEGLYIKMRFKLGAPVGNRSSFVREKIALASVVALVAGVLIVPAITGDSKGAHVVQGQSEIAGSPILADQQPEFPVLTPGGKGAKELGGFAKISPSGSDDVYAYVDKIGEVGIRVSQQLVPDNIKNNISELEQLAENFNANRTIEVGGKDIYIGKNASGPQSVLFIDKDLLVLISSDADIGDEQWTDYINNLKR